MNISSDRDRRALWTAALFLGVWAATASAAWGPGHVLPNLGGFSLEGEVPSVTGKVVLVDFCASWCAPCKASFPVLNQLQRRFGDKGFAVLAVSVDKDPAAWTRFLKEHPVAFPTVRDGHHKLVAAAGVEAMPTSFLVDREGKIRYVQKGFQGAETEVKLVKEIEALLGPPGAVK
jgi:thiol-disulfide isomerase/thioredoxin